MSTQDQAMSVTTAPREVQEFLRSTPAHVVGGTKRPSRSREEIEIVDPSTGDVISHIARGRAEDVDAAVQAADSALRSSSWTNASPATRESLLHRLATLIDENIETLALLETLDNGMPLPLARNLDIAGAADVVRYMAGWPTKIAGRTMTFESPGGNRAMGYTRREPVGVVGGIIPWNVPFMLAIWKVAPALAAGCTIVLKPAEDTSLTALFLGDLVLQAGFPPGVVNIVTGTGPEAGQPLTEHPLVSKIFFTGSTTTGIAVGRAAASHAKPVSLELGGKSPTIIFADADLEAAAAGAAESIFLNSGQICVAGSRLYLHHKIADQFLDTMVDQAKQIRIGDPLEEATQMGPLATTAQLERIEKEVAFAQEEGGKLLHGGQRPAQPNRGWYYEPTIIECPDQKLRIVDTELFGPVLSVLRFETEEEVIKLANDTNSGSPPAFSRATGRAPYGSHGRPGPASSGSIPTALFRPSPNSAVSRIRATDGKAASRRSTTIRGRRPCGSTPRAHR